MKLESTHGLRNWGWSGLTIALLAGFASPSDAYCQEEIATKREPLQEVFQSELVYTQEKGQFQMTFTPTYVHGSRTFHLGQSLEYGLTDSWQVQMNWAAYNRRHSPSAEVVRGPGDISAGTQYSFMNVSGSNTHAALGFETTFAVGDTDKGFGEGVTSYEPYVAVARDFPSLRNLQIFSSLNLGIVHKKKTNNEVEAEGRAAHELGWSGGFFLPVSRAVVLVNEFSWTSNRWNNHGDERSFYLTPGLVLSLPGNWEVGFAIPIGVGEGSDKSRATLQITHEFRLGRQGF